MPAPFGFHVDRAGFKCTSGPAPGARALRDGVLEADTTGGLFDLGIFNCRPPRGAAAGGRVSLHGEGRAWDAGVRPGHRAAGDALAALLVALAPFLGVQRVIWQRREWDAAERAWEPYRGVDPHTTHLHVELCWAAARGLTLAEVRQALADDDDQEEEMADSIVWYRHPVSMHVHPYRVVGIEGKHLDPKPLALARLCGIKEPKGNEWGSQTVPLDKTWQGMVALLDGPCKNV